MGDTKQAIQSAIRNGLARKGLKHRDLVDKLKPILGGRINVAVISSYSAGVAVPPGETLIEIIRELDLVADLFPDQVAALQIPDTIPDLFGYQ